MFLKAGLIHFRTACFYLSLGRDYAAQRFILLTVHREKIMPDLQTMGVIFVIALIAALAIAWLVGHVDAVAAFVNLDQA